MSKKQPKTKPADATVEGNAAPANPENQTEKKESKAAVIIKLLMRPQGATLEQMMNATGWQKHSIRGFMAGTLKNKHGITAVSAKVDGSRTYRVEAAGIQS